MAEREGFEPPIAFRLCLISSQVHSTGLCHLSAERAAHFPLLAGHFFRSQDQDGSVPSSCFPAYHPRPTLKPDARVQRHKDEAMEASFGPKRAAILRKPVPALTSLLAKECRLQCHHFPLRPVPSAAVIAALPERQHTHTAHPHFRSGFHTSLACRSRPSLLRPPPK
jgi:hypothetical protein